MLPSLLLMTGMLSRVASLSSVSFVPRRWQRTGRSSSSVVAVSSRLTMSLAAPAAVVNLNTVDREYGVLEELASRVVSGKAAKALPAATQLKRRRSWDLFLGESDGSRAAVLVVNKKSSFTLHDARTAMDIMRDEAVARRLDGPENPTRHLLLVTRAGVAPVAEAFVRGSQARPFSAAGATTIMGWAEVEGLVQEGGLGRYLATSTSTLKSQSGLPQAPPFALPAWLLEERERGAKATFDLQSPFEPSGDQPDAIETLCRGLEEGKRHQTLLGATGTGKTFIVANVIQKTSLPTLVLAPNKVLAAQLTNELRALFPNNAVEFFVSYYDYFMPEAFVSASDTYIDKVVEINDDIDRMRHSATRSLLERRDVIVVASVSCIYGLGMPSKYLEASTRLVVGQEWAGGWITLAQHLEQNLFYSPQHNDGDFKATPRGSFRAVCHAGGGGIVEIGPSTEESIIRVTVDETGVVRRMQAVPTANGGKEGKHGEAPRSLSAALAAGGIEDIDWGGRGQKTLEGGPGESDVEAHVIYPAKHHVAGRGEMEEILAAITAEMEERCLQLGRDGKVLESERLRQRTENDLLLLQAVGTCKGVENYSRHLAGRGPGDPPETLVDYFPQDDWLLIVDESHVSAPQLGAMWGGDRARKSKLVDHGFRLPSALDNRPLKAGEFWAKVNKCIFVSATPGKFELELSNPEKLRSAPRSRAGTVPAEKALHATTLTASADVPFPKLQPRRRKAAGRSGLLGWDEIGDIVDAQAVIRPTGITDPPVDIRPSEGQVADLVRECRARGERGERVLVTALTKRMAEDLCAFLVEQGVPTAYLHSDVKPMKRLELLRQLRSGEVDVIVGVNLLREGLNLPEVSLVCVLDADAEGFLRSDTALLQTIGRATRHQAGRAVLYADRVTPSMQRALAETDRRRDIQITHNEVNGITPSVARAASVGDSLLDSICKDNTTGRREGLTTNGEGIVSDDHVASWAEHSLPPDQVQLLYNLAAHKGKDGARRGLPAARATPASLAKASCGDATGTRSIEHTQSVPFVASEDTLRALKRLAEQANRNMLASASKTDFKDAAMWRDRRDALLSTMRHLEEAQDSERDVLEVGCS